MFNLTHNQMLPLDKLDQIIDGGAANQYKNASPFAHGVYDDVFDTSLLDKVIDEFEQGEKAWKQFDTKYELKLQMNKDVNLQPVTRAFIHNLNSEPFLSFLEKLTGIDGLIPDPYLKGAGLHKIPRGGKLGVHVDFNIHKEMNVYRRLNVLIYLNKDWEEEYGGHFELWDGLEGSCQQKILPLFNRMAIFSTTSYSFHGHPKPLNCPEDRCRRSIAMYYYTAGDHGDQVKDSHSTQFLDESGNRDDLSDKSLKARIKKLINRE